MLTSETQAVCKIVTDRNGTGHHRTFFCFLSNCNTLIHTLVPGLFGYCLIYFFLTPQMCYCSCNLNKLALLHQSYNFSYSLGFDVNVNTTVTQKKTRF